MTDWIRIDYNEPTTWPENGSRIEGLRWLGFDEAGWWHAVDAVVAYVNLPGFALNDQRCVGFGLGPVTFEHLDTPPEGAPEPPPDGHADWWRPFDG